MLFTFIIGQCFTTMLCSMRYGVFLFFAGMPVVVPLVHTVAHLCGNSVALCNSSLKPSTWLDPKACHITWLLVILHPYEGRIPCCAMRATYLLPVNDTVFCGRRLSNAAQDARCLRAGHKPTPHGVRQHLYLDMHSASSCHVARVEPLASCGAGCLVLAGLTTYFLFPETSGIPVEQTHTVFKDHWAWPRLYPEILQVSLP